MGRSAGNARGTGGVGVTEQSADGKERDGLPEPEKVADELAEISRRLDGEMDQREHGYLQAADEYLRILQADTDHDGIEQA